MNTENDTPTAEEFTGRATYCPEDNKLRLYVGRVPREEFLKLRAEGWTTLSKQREAGGGDFSAVWTPDRRDTALDYAGIIEDEDMGPAERAADRAERFAGYREKRTSEATGRADAYDAGPQAHGFQSQARAERSARRHDRIAGRACDAWSKAEYWQRRTGGVISHALHVSTPSVRMGRIKTIEAEQRKLQNQLDECAERFRAWQKIAAMTDAESQNKAAHLFAGGHGDYFGKYTHPRTGREGSLYDLTHPEKADPITGAEACALYLAAHIDPASPRWLETPAGDWARHYELRLAYENQMIEAEGGRAAVVEMEVGGWIGGHQIRKINKSPATGLVVSVEVMGRTRGFTKESGYTREESRPCPVLLNVERLTADAYRAPTDEDRATLAATLKTEKAAAPKKEVCPLINPTEEDALKLQALLNADERPTSTPAQIVKLTFAQYDGRGCVKVICENGTEHRSRYGQNLTRSDVFKVRTVYGDSCGARRVVILTDKPQKCIPWDAVAKAKAAAPSAEKLLPRMAELVALVIELEGTYRAKTNEEQKLLCDAEYLGWVNLSCSRAQWTDAGAAARKQYEAAGVKSALFSASESLELNLS